MFESVKHSLSDFSTAKLIPLIVSVKNFWVIVPFVFEPCSEYNFIMPAASAVAFGNCTSQRTNLSLL